MNWLVVHRIYANGMACDLSGTGVMRALRCYPGPTPYAPSFTYGTRDKSRPAAKPDSGRPGCAQIFGLTLDIDQCLLLFGLGWLAVVWLRGEVLPSGCV
jgi:hypothetical protein